MTTTQKRTKEEIRERWKQRGADDGKCMSFHWPPVDSEELNDIYHDAFYESLEALPSHDLADLLVPAEIPPFRAGHYSINGCSLYMDKYRIGLDSRIDGMKVDWRHVAFVNPSPEFKQAVSGAQCLYGIEDLSFKISRNQFAQDCHGDDLMLELSLDRICRYRRLAFVTKESVERFMLEHGERDRRFGSTRKEVEARQEESKRGALENIALMEADGERLLLPQDTQFKNYNEIKRIMETAGGKYSKNAFVFKGKDAQEIKDRLLDGEKVNDKKKFQFFATPQKVVDRVVELAELTDWHDILEPSAGKGNMVDGIDMDQVTCFELWEDNVKVLKEKGYAVKEGDFLKMEPDMEYDRILANPPFTNDQDIDHVRHMYEWIKPGGRIVSIMSTAWRHGTTKKKRDFREWLEHVEAETETVDAGAFKESGTGIETVIVTIDKPEGNF